MSRILHRSKHRRPKGPPADQAVRRFGHLLTFLEAAAYLGVGQTRLREVRDLDRDFPEPVRLPGANPLELYRREDLVVWVRGLRPVERQRVSVSVPERALA